MSATVNNCLADEDPQVAPQLCNVALYVLPTNTTSQIQALDADICSVIKFNYLPRLQYCVFVNIDTGKDYAQSVHFDCREFGQGRKGGACN